MRASGPTSSMADSFNAEVDLFMDNVVPEKIVEVMKTAALELIKKLIEKSPVDTGRFRSSWVCATNTPNDAIPVFTSDDGGAQATQRVLDGLSELKPGDTFIISSNLSYSLLLEYGWSKQAPNGLADISALEVGNEIQALIDRGDFSRN